MNKQNAGFKPQVLFLLHYVLLLFFIGLIFYVIQRFLLDSEVSDLFELLSYVEISWLIGAAIILMGMLYAAPLILKKNTPLGKSYHKQSLLAISLIVVLYVYGQQDRFLISTNSIEDLVDFSFILVLVTLLWGLTTLVFRIFREKFSTLRKPAFLLTRGFTLLVLLIPLDLVLNYLFLKQVYTLPLYEDYWVLEVPFKVLIVLLINFLDEIILTKPDPLKPVSIKVRIGNTHRFIELDQVAYFLVKNQVNYLHTISGEKFITDLTLVQLEKKLENRDFFRANRQLLIARKAVESYKSADGKKIELNLSGIENSTNTHYISRLGAPSFRKWIRSELGTIQS